jgi:hypothetical protein
VLWWKDLSIGRKRKNVLTRGGLSLLWSERKAGCRTYICGREEEEVAVKGFSSIWMIIRECYGDKKTDLAFHEHGKTFPIKTVTGKTKRPLWEDFSGDDRIALW